MSNYSDLLKDPRWQKKRLEIFNRDKYTCQLCSDKNTTLVVHHKRYIPGHSPWEYKKTDLITYCECCHAFVERNKKIKGLNFDDVKALYINSGRTWSARIYRYNEIAMVYIFNSVNQIIYSVPLTEDVLSEIKKVLS